MTRTTATQVVLFNVLNDEFVVGHVGGLVPAHLPRSHSLQHAVTVLSVDAIFEN